MKEAATYSQGTLFGTKVEKASKGSSSGEKSKGDIYKDDRTRTLDGRKT